MRSIPAGCPRSENTSTSSRQDLRATAGPNMRSTVSNGTTGLHLALATLGLEAGDEVIIPDLTFVATANAVAYTGATPVLADIDADTLCLDPASVKSLISPRTKAIMPVHLYGHPADMDALERDRRGQRRRRHRGCRRSPRCRIQGPPRRRSRPMRGVQLLRQQGDHDRRRRHADHQRSGALSARQATARSRHAAPQRRYFHEERGFNYRITNLQAALGVAQLERIDEFLGRGAPRSWTGIAGEIATTGKIRLNRVKNWAKSAFWMICLEVDGFDEKRRDAFMQAAQDARHRLPAILLHDVLDADVPAGAVAGRDQQGADRPQPAVLLRADQIRRSAHRGGGERDPSTDVSRLSAPVVAAGQET